MAALKPASKPLYSVVLLVEASPSYNICTTYFRISQVGETRTAPAPAPCKEKDPSNYRVHSFLSLIPGIEDASWRYSSSSGVGVHSATKSASTLLLMVEELT